MLFLLMAMFWKKMGRSENMIRFRRLAVPLTVATLVYGILVGNYFGIQPSRDTLLGSLRLPWLDPQNQMQMMALTIIIGALHLILANLISAWKYRKNGKGISYIGWCCLIIAGLIAGFKWQTQIDPRIEDLPLDAVLLGLGVVLILGFSSDRAWTLSPKGLLLRGFDGLKSVGGVSQMFSDVLSYLRLFALALASTQLAVTFNQLASDMWNQAGFGVLLAILIIVMGHVMNFVLALMSGVVHGLRLVCIEFFHWSLPEEGILFQPFRKKAGE
jgi:V/A-type H+-transporting ATPase subunit I